MKNHFSPANILALKLSFDSKKTSWHITWWVQVSH